MSYPVDVVRLATPNVVRIVFVKNSVLRVVLKLVANAVVVPRFVRNWVLNSDCVTFEVS